MGGVGNVRGIPGPRLLRISKFVALSNVMIGRNSFLMVAVSCARDIPEQKASTIVAQKDANRTNIFSLMALVEPAQPSRGRYLISDPVAVTPVVPAKASSLMEHVPIAHRSKEPPLQISGHALLQYVNRTREF
jgi:hypothetical protein